MKRCSNCAELKPESEFYQLGKPHKGLRPDCKDCHNLRYWRDRDHRLDQNLAWHKANPEKHRAIQRRWLAKRRDG